MKVEVDVLGSRPNKSTVSVDVKQHFSQLQVVIVKYGQSTLGCTYVYIYTHTHTLKLNVDVEEENASNEDKTNVYFVLWEHLSEAVGPV